MEAISTGSFIGPQFYRGEGCFLYDKSERRFFDGTAGSGAISLGHQEVRVLSAVRDQVDKLIHTGCKLSSDTRAQLAEKVCNLSPFEQCVGLFTVIGTEAVEASLKVARAYTGRKSVIAFKHAYHGKSSGALGITWREQFKSYSNLKTDDIFIASFPPYEPESESLKSHKDDIDSYLTQFQNLIDTAIASGDTPAAVILEPIQVSEGVLSPGKRFLEGVIKISRQAKILVIFDEIYTGLGRCGSLFYCNKLSVIPDLLLIGKTLGNGFPISMVLGEPRIVNALPAGIQTSTYSGSPLSCAAASSVIDIIIETQLWNEANCLGKKIIEFLKDLQASYSFISLVRGEGMLLAFDCIDEYGNPSPALAKKFSTIAMSNDLLLFVGGFNECSVKIIPPILMNSNDLEFLLNSIGETAKKLNKRM